MAGGIKEEGWARVKEGQAEGMYVWVGGWIDGRSDEVKRNKQAGQASKQVGRQAGKQTSKRAMGRIEPPRAGFRGLEEGKRG